MYQKGDYVMYEYETGESFPGVIEEINGGQYTIQININLRKTEDSELETVMTTIDKIKPYIPSFN